MTTRRDFVKGLAGATIVVVPTVATAAMKEEEKDDYNDTTIIWTGENTEGNANQLKALSIALVTAGLVTSKDRIKVTFDDRKSS